MQTKLIDPQKCQHAFGVMLRQGRALVLVKSQDDLQDACADLYAAGEDLRVPLQIRRMNGAAELRIADGVPKDHNGRIDIRVYRAGNGLRALDVLRGTIAHLILHPFNVTPSAVYPVLATTGGEAIRYQPAPRPLPAVSLES